MPIYTRTGDKGKTSLLSGQRVLKDDLRVDAYGTIDELNSAIGVVIAETQNSPLRRSAAEAMVRKRQGFMGQAKFKNELTLIQNDLLDIGSALASSQGVALKNLKKRVKDFENFIDKMTLQMPKLNNFILPGGGNTGATLHLTRAVCRRAERKIVELNNRHPSAGSGYGKVDSNMIIYLNRLSDLLFTMARFANFKEKKKESIWPA